MIRKEVSGKVLIIGPHHRNHRGGIGAVISNQKEYYETFNFIPTYRYDRSTGMKIGYFARQFFLIFRFLLINRGIRIVHIHSSVNGSFYRKLLVMLMARYLFRKKIINHLHSGAYDLIYQNANRLQKNIMHRFFRLSHVTVTVSAQWQEFIARQFNLHQVHYISNPVPPQRPEIRDRRSPVITLLFLGLICREKGIYDLLDVLSQNRRAFSNRIRLVIGGNGEVENLRRIIRENGLDHMVSFRGWVTDQAKHQLMVSSDLFILPSYGEGMPVSVLEALSYGKAVIATRVGGIPEIVKHDVNGLLITPGDQTAILHSICYYLNEPLKLQRHGQASRSLVREYYPENVMPKVETLYQSLI